MKKVNIPELQKNPAAVFRRMHKGDRVSVVRRGVVLVDVILLEEWDGVKRPGKGKRAQARKKK